MSGNLELFTTRMRKATRKIHSVSDALVNAKFALSLREGTVWAGGLFAFYHVFGFIEDAKERLNMPDFNKLFVHKILYRKQAFEADLNYYLGENWHSLPKSPALENYLYHLQGLETENPQMLMAYMYHLYLGLLSGGQILSRKRQMFGQTSANNYVDKVTDFSSVDIQQLKKDIREAMNEIADKMSEEEKLAFIEESNQVFLMNNLIVDAVGGQAEALKILFYKTCAMLAAAIAVFVAYRMTK